MDLDFANNQQPTAPAQAPGTSSPGQPAPAAQAPGAPQNPPPGTVPPPPPPPTPTGLNPPSSNMPPPPPSGAPVTPIEESGSNRGLIILVIVGLLVVIAGVVGYLVYRNNQSSSLPPENITLDDTTSGIDQQILNRDTQRKEDLSKIQQYLELYFADNKSYPLTKSFQRFNETGSLIYASLVPQYASADGIPLDPLDPVYWYGYRSVDGTTYELTAQLENLSDAEGFVADSGIFLYTLTPSGPKSNISTTPTPTL